VKNYTKKIFINAQRSSMNELRRFDEVDEAVPNKRMTIHEILLKGKRAPRLPFEDDLRPPGGKI
jgi:hypothetical protein